MDRIERLDDHEESLRMALDGNTSQIWTALPGIIKSFNETKQTVSVQPAIQGIVGNQAVNLPLLVDVPVQFFNAGGYSITIPISVNDECLVVFASRCIDAWWQLGGVQPPLEPRMHDLSDGFALIGFRSSSRPLASYSTSKLQIRSDDNNTFIEVDKTGAIKLKAVTVNIEATDVAITSTTLTHNSVNIGATHKHSGVMIGTSITGLPQ
jgi:hypothetical protein